MKDKNLNGEIHSSMYHQCQERDYATPVDVLMDIGGFRKRSTKIAIWEGYGIVNCSQN